MKKKNLNTNNGCVINLTNDEKKICDIDESLVVTVFNNQPQGQLSGRKECCKILYCGRQINKSRALNELIIMFPTESCSYLFHFGAISMVIKLLK